MFPLSLSGTLARSLSAETTPILLAAVQDLACSSAGSQDMFVEAVAALGFPELPWEVSSVRPSDQRTIGGEVSPSQLSEMFPSLGELYAQARSRRNCFTHKLSKFIVEISGRE